MSDTLLCFPSFDILLARLEAHKHTSLEKDSYLYTKEVIASVAKAFCSKQFNGVALDLKIQLTLFDGDPEMYSSFAETVATSIKSMLVACCDK